MRNPDDFRQLDYVATPVFVLEVLPSGAPTYVTLNASGCAMAGRPRSDFFNRTAREIYPGAFGRSAYERHCTVVASGVPLTYDIELPLGGIDRKIRTTLTPEFDDHGNVHLLYGSSIDVTAERAAQEAKVSFDTVASEMEQFIAMAAHDLRAPMRNVSLLAEMLRDDFVDHGDGKLEVIKMMEDVATKSMSLITDVLAHARATAPKNQQTTFVLKSLCRDISDVLDPQDHHKFNVTATKVTADRTAVQIALRNIIDNAVKHSQRAHLNMVITVTSAGTDRLDFTLTDDGKGFDTSALAFLNGGDFGVDSGYGLLGVRRMIAARGGSITASNGPQGGGIIQFSMPGTCVRAVKTMPGKTSHFPARDNKSSHSGRRTA